MRLLWAALLRRARRLSGVSPQSLQPLARLRSKTPARTQRVRALSNGSYEQRWPAFFRMDNTSRN